MISVFRKNDLFNVVLLLPYTIVLRSYSILSPTSYQVVDGDTILARWIFSSAIPDPLAQSIIGIVVVYIQAALINLMANDHRLFTTPSALSGMSYVLLLSCYKGFQGLSPALLGLTFVILATYSIFNTYKIAQASKGIVNASLSGSLGVLIYFPLVIFLICYLIGLGMMRSFGWRERLQFLFGFGVLFWITGSVLFSFDLLDWSLLSSFGGFGVWSLYQQGDAEVLMLIGLPFLLVIIALFNYYTFRKKKGIDIRKKLDYFYWTLLSTFIAVLFFDPIAIGHLQMLASGLAIFIGLWFYSLRSGFIAETLHLLFIVGAGYAMFMA
ncbi:MAG: hypothetical protein AAFR14_01160 [Bacteroidota bacterium]